MRKKRKKLKKHYIITILAITSILLLYKGQLFFISNQQVTFDEAVRLQTSSEMINTINNNGEFTAANRHQVESAMRISFRDTEFKYMELTHPIKMSEKEVNQMLHNKGILDGHGQQFLAAQKQYKINVIYLVSHALVETGEGQSTLAKGITDGQQRYYNFFGIGAFDSNAIQTGKSYAKTHHWTSPNKAIIDGASFISSHYFDQGQVSLYQMRWNPANPAHHQYATDIYWDEQIANYMAHFYKQYGIKKDRIQRDFYR